MANFHRQYALEEKCFQQTIPLKWKAKVLKVFVVDSPRLVLCFIKHHSRCWFPLTGINKEPCANHGLSRNCNSVRSVSGKNLVQQGHCPPKDEKADKTGKARRLAFNALTLLSRTGAGSGIESISHFETLSVFLFSCLFLSRKQFV